MWKKDRGSESLCIFHYSEDEKAAAESGPHGNAGRPRRSTLINTGSRNDAETSDYVWRTNKRITWAHASHLPPNNEKRLGKRFPSPASLRSFDSISSLRETDEITVLTSTHDQSSQENTHIHTFQDKTSTWASDIIISNVVSWVKAGWNPVSSRRRLYCWKGYYSHALWGIAKTRVTTDTSLGELSPPSTYT